ncbi:hypothetical protein EBT25_08410 [bacterium]|nr:hypothetical protein [bacterium]
MPIIAVNQVTVESRISAKRQDQRYTRVEAARVTPPVEHERPQPQKPPRRPDYAAMPETKLTVGNKNIDHPLLKINGQDPSTVKRSQYMADMLTSTN